MKQSSSWAHYPSPPASLVAKSVACVGIGEQSGRLPAVLERVLPVHGVVVITKGKGYYSDASRKLTPVMGPCTIWIFPELHHSYGPDREGWCEQWLIFSGAWPLVLQEAGLVDQRRPVRPLVEVPSSFQTSFIDLRVETARLGAVPELRASIALQTALTALAGSAQQTLDHQDEQAVLRTFAEAAALNLPMAERARRLGMSIPALRRFIRSTTGLSPQQLIAETRLSRARELLSETDLSVAEIASRVGLPDASYFSRHFSRSTGLSPRHFRTHQREAPAPSE